MGIFLKLGSIIVFLFVLIWRRVETGLAILFTAVFLSILFRLPLSNLRDALLRGLFGTLTLKIIAAVYLVRVLGQVLEESGFSKKLLTSMENTIKDRRLSLIIPPLIFGLFPVPAGALLSAPLAREVGVRMNAPVEYVAFFNYWFRHTWEYSWPLYAGVILGAGMLDMRIEEFSIRMLPLVFASFLVGLIFLFLTLRSERTVELNGRGNVKKLILTLWPIYLIAVLILILRLHFLISLVLVIIVLLIVSRLSKEKMLKVLKQGVSLRTFLLVISVMIFKHVLEMSGVVEQLPEAFSRYQIPALVPLVFVLFLTGLLTGIASAGIGISFPVFNALLKQDFGLVMIAYAAVMAGVLVSPVHLCLVVSGEFFDIDLKKLYRLIIPGVFFILLFSFAVWAIF